VRSAEKAYAAALARLDQALRALARDNPPPRLYELVLAQQEALIKLGQLCAARHAIAQRRIAALERKLSQAER
jgi:hypothetical protein